MDHSEFRIGATFSCGGGLWRCTDVGTRVVTAVRIDRAEIETTDPKTGGRTRKVIDARQEDGWLSGPPYALAETVFDEDDHAACEPVEGAM